MVNNLFIVLNITNIAQGNDNKISNKNLSVIMTSTRNQKNNVEVKTISDALAGNAEQIDGIIAQIQKNDDDNQKTVDFFADCASRNQMLFNDLYSFAYEIKAILEDLKK